MKKLTALFAMLLILATCTKDLSDFNNSNTPPPLPEEVLASATISLFDMMADVGNNRNMFRIFAQYWTEATFPGNFKYIVDGVSENTWIVMYTDVLKNLKETKTLLDEDVDISVQELQAQKAVITVLESYVYVFLVDLYGNIPYSQAVSDNLKPHYDNGIDIYNAVIINLNKAIGQLKEVNSLAITDLIYQGNSVAWQKMANALKLKLAIRLADYDNTLAKSVAEEAIAEGVFESSADDFLINYHEMSPNTNPLWIRLVESGRFDYVATNTIGDVLNTLNDPRRSAFFKNLDVDGNVIGGSFGFTVSYNATSQPGSLLENPTLPSVIMSYTEVLFLLADAAERGYSAGGTPDDFYAAAVKNSILDWNGSVDDAMTYLAQADVAYETAPGTWKEKIGVQKWLALYNRGFEAWATYKLYDAPAFNFPQSDDIKTPLRLLYPETETTLNTVNVEAASAAIGGDKMTTKVFWDVN